MERVWKGSWLWAAAAAAGLALVMVAIMLSSGGSAPTVSAQGSTSTPTNTTAPTATATPLPCDLSITKDVDDTSVAIGDTANYTITVTNESDDTTCDHDIRVIDAVPDNMDCTDASVDSDSDISSSHVDINTGCDNNGTVRWTATSNLSAGDSLILDLSMDVTSDASVDDHITNTACVDRENSQDIGSDTLCDDQRITVSGASSTSTPTTAPTATPGTPLPTVVAPTARPTTPPLGGVAPTISVPVTGTGGSSGGGSSPWPLTLGLLGGVLMLGSGVVLVKRTR